MVWKNLKGKYKATSIQKEVVLLIVGLICQTPSSITARGSRRPFHQNAQLMLSLIDWRHPDFRENNEWDVYILIFFFRNRNIHLYTFLLSKNQARIVNIVFLTQKIIFMDLGHNFQSLNKWHGVIKKWWLYWYR